ncbi:VOC family protein [Rhizobium esperanzae]|uniref:Catechol 2,3-dioxygenase-like lactoylglutathione lyase family enzyme n=1 Tax=Rhizobium esperanzae TaxID=1967781 RepID=A0A7W6R5M5_9HYPH|nr:VOC family protein [Rhizobium esperanzae]MBB4236632.1 catechol 2,3-dioxygenase-like lactoylglutathione lyase family enzyme [Rhizobium esperanzae]
METDLPAAALGHFVIKVQDIDASYQFYVGLGLRASGTFPGVAVVELRGGTHLLLFQKNDDQAAALLSSRNGQRPEYSSEKLDLMIAGRTRADLEVYRVALIDKGYSPSAMADGNLYGHHYFSMQDPDGNGISFYTSHIGDQPV